MQVAWPTGSPKKRGEWVQVAADWVLFQEMWRGWENVEARGPGTVFKIEALISDSFGRALKFQPFSCRVGSNPRCQSENIEMKYKTHIKLVHEL